MTQTIKCFKVVFFLIFLKFSGQENAYENEDSEKEKTLKISYRLTAGLNIGGLSPIPLPNNIRKIKSYNPGFNPSLGLEGIYHFNKKWGLGLNPRLEYKGMKVKDSVMYFHTLIQMGEEGESSSFEGDFTGTNYTSSRNLYLSLPIFVEFTPKEKWNYRVGSYVALLLDSKFEGNVSDGYIRNGNSLGEKINVTSAKFDFSEKLRKFDFGMYAGIKRDFGKHFSADVSLQWGLISAFPKSFSGISFPMYNVFGQLGAGYSF